jgi:hypothetical protein
MAETLGRSTTKSVLTQGLFLRVRSHQLMQQADVSPQRLCECVGVYACVFICMCVCRDAASSHVLRSIWVYTCACIHIHSAWRVHIWWTLRHRLHSMCSNGVLSTRAKNERLIHGARKEIVVLRLSLRHRLHNISSNAVPAPMLTLHNSEC